MKLRDYVTGRVVAWLLIALLGAWFGICRASAATPDTSQCSSSQTDTWCASEPAAYAAASSRAAALQAALGSVPSKLCGPTRQGPFTGGAYDPHYRVLIRVIPAAGQCSDGGGYSSVTRRWQEGSSCPRGVDPVTLQCFPTEQQCLDKPAQGGGSIAASATSACVNGCAYGPPAGEGPTTMSFNGTAFVAITKAWVPTGGTCDGNMVPSPNEQPACTPLGDGQTACAMPDGKTCYSAGGGVPNLQFCWNPGETGQKSHEDQLQKTDPGLTAVAPAPPANGDTLNPVGPPISTTINNDNRHIETTTQNYANEHGTNAGDSDQGDTNGDGQPDGEGEGEGDGEGEDGSVSGGSGCDAPPVCAGDPVMCGVVDQSWRNRCGEQQGDANGDGRPDWTELGEGEGPEGMEPNGDEVAQEWDFPGLDMLDDGGFLSNTCPEFPTMNLGPLGSYNLDFPWWCDLLASLGAVFVFICGCAALMVLVS